MWCRDPVIARAPTQQNTACKCMGSGNIKAIAYRKYMSLEIKNNNIWKKIFFRQ